MNHLTNIEPPIAALQPPQPPQPHRRSTSCDHHPGEHFSGFCPSCLSERLSLLNPNTTTTITLPSSSSSSHFNPSKSNNINEPSCSTSSSSLFTQLRRTKSFSASKNIEAFRVFEPQRKSCDVRGVRNTLSSLFSLEDDNNFTHSSSNGNVSSVESRRKSVQNPVFESNEDGLVGGIEEIEEDGKNEVFDHRVVPEVVEEEEEVVRDDGGVEEAKTIKDHIDCDLNYRKSVGRDFKEFAGSFWSAASVFSNKLQKWRRRQKGKKLRNGSGSATLPLEKSIKRQMRETQSEIADYGYGRRSCDTDPRFSLDAGRMSFDAARVSFEAARMSFDAARISFDDPRYSFDEPRASWDGYLVGRNTVQPRMPTMLSVVEDAPVQVLRTDSQISAEEASVNSINEVETVPGGTIQTWDYYSDSSSRRRKSLDRSSSIKKSAASVVAEIDETKPTPCANSKVSPTKTDYLPRPKFAVPNKDTNSNYSSSIMDDCLDTLDVGSRDNASVIGNISNGERSGPNNSWRWNKAWNIWGLIYRRGRNKENDDRCSNANGIERSFSESWQDLPVDSSSDARGIFNKFRSKSSAGWRSSGNFGGRNFRKKGYEANGNDGKRRDELYRNRSARYSPNNVDNGLLRFYLTPMRNSRRNGSVKTRSSHDHSLARSLLRLY